MEVWQICLICGAIGLLIVLLFSISTGVGNGNLTPVIKFDNTCDSNKVELPTRYSKIAEKSSYKLSNLFAPGSCPTGYTFFTDLDGNSLCCGSSKIDIFERKCSARGSQGVCAFVPGIVDARDGSKSTTYPMCSIIAAANQQRQSGSLCPSKYKYHVSLPSKSYKCCSSHVNPGATDCNSGSKFCNGLQKDQNVFNTPESCETNVLLESIECPDSTNIILDFKLPKHKGLSAPICIGTKGNCLPRKVIEHAQKIGLFSDIDINTNIMNCEIYDKYYNERTLNESQIQTKISKDL